MSVRRGFILHPTYRIEAGRPVVHLHGRLEEGPTFLLRDTRLKPHFWVRACDAARARELGALPLDEAGRRTLRGEPAARVEVALPADTPPLRNRLQADGIPCYEADVRFAMRYLIDRGIRGALAIDGEPRPGGAAAGLLFDDPQVAPADWSPRLSVLSFDIETDPAAGRLLSIALYGAGAAEVLLADDEGGGSDAGLPPFTTVFAGERELLAAFCRRVRELDPDVLTGWNVIDFDLAVLARRAERLGVRLELGRGGGETLRVRPARSRWASSQATVTGRVVLDGIRLLRGAFVRMDDYSLDAVAKSVLGEGKTFVSEQRGAEILDLFHRDRPRLAEYNLNDARLVSEILDRMHLVELTVERSRLTGLPLDRVSASIAAFDFLYLSALGPLGVVAPSVGTPGASGDPGEPHEPTAGGHVLEPAPGLYENVLVFDFKSLYPSLIRSFEIDPLGYLPAPRPEDDPIVAPNGAAFRRERGILPRLLDELFPRREAAKAAGDTVASHAIKILMNSFYGVLATPACRFYDAALANAITSFGKELLLWTKARSEKLGHRVLYGDTDSLFVESGEADAPAARRAGERLVERLNRDLARHVERRWRVESRLELELETVYLRLLLPAMRHGGGGARKRYVGLVEEADGERRVVFTGMEAVRRDWTELAKRAQAELYDRLFAGRPVDSYLSGLVADLRAGRLDDHLVYRKALRKELAAYTATTPPHVAAARKAGGGTARLVAYLMTTAGPEPAAARTSPIDHEHYVQKQIRPVAEPVLAILHLDFDKVVGDDRQLDLFP